MHRFPFRTFASRSPCCQLPHPVISKGPPNARVQIHPRLLSAMPFTLPSRAPAGSHMRVSPTHKCVTLSRHSQLRPRRPVWTHGSSGCYAGSGGVALCGHLLSVIGVPFCSAGPGDSWRLCPRSRSNAKTSTLPCPPSPNQRSSPALPGSPASPNSRPSLRQPPMPIPTLISPSRSHVRRSPSPESLRPFPSRSLRPMRVLLHISAQ